MTALHRERALQDRDDRESLAEREGCERRSGKTADDRNVDHLARGFNAAHIEVGQPDAVETVVCDGLREFDHRHAVLQPVRAVLNVGMPLGDVANLDLYVGR